MNLVLQENPRTDILVSKMKDGDIAVITIE